MGVHEGSVLSPLFIMVHEALCEFRSGCPQKLSSVDDRV